MALRDSESRSALGRFLRAPLKAGTALRIRSGIAPISLGGPGLSRAEMGGPALLIRDAAPAVASMLKVAEETLEGAHSTAGHMGQDLTFFFGEASHHLGVVFHAYLEVEEEAADLAAKTSRLVPNARELARSNDSETIRHHLSRVGTSRL